MKMKEILIALLLSAVVESNRGKMAKDLRLYIMHEHFLIAALYLVQKALLKAGFHQA